MTPSSLVDEKLSLSDIGKEAARLYAARVAAGNLQPLSESTVNYLTEAIAQQNVRIEQFREHTTWVLSDSKLDQDTLEIAKAKSSEIMGHKLSHLGNLSLRLSRKTALLASEELEIKETFKQASGNALDHYIKNSEAYYELAVIEAHLQGKTPALEAPISIGLSA